MDRLAFAGANDGVNTRFAFSRRDAPEFCINLPPKEGVGNAGCPLHPQPRVQIDGRKHER